MKEKVKDVGFSYGLVCGCRLHLYMVVPWNLFLWLKVQKILLTMLSPDC